MAATLELRPLTLGELLDRTFFLYRRHFLLFVGVSALPYSLFFIAKLAVVLLPALAGHASSAHSRSSGIVAMAVGGGLVGLITVLVGCIAFLYAVGAAVHAVAEIYAGRTTSIRDSLGSVRGKSGTIFGVMFLTGLLLIAGLIAFIVPFFYIMCRLSVAIPAAVLENLGPAEAIRRSFALTRNFAGRAFMIYLLYFAIAFGVIAVFQFPFAMLMVLSAKQPHLVMIWTIVMQLGNFIASSVVSPVSMIGFAVFYYDLRVRKEAFDLQIMMQAIGADPSSLPVTGRVPSMFGRDAS
jgi:hypothetical protein